MRDALPPRSRSTSRGSAWVRSEIECKKRGVSKAMISVIVPCYGPVYAKFLKECVESVKAQTFKDWEVVIATGGPRDESGK